MYAYKLNIDNTNIEQYVGQVVMYQLKREQIKSCIHAWLIRHHTCHCQIEHLVASYVYFFNMKNSLSM